MTTEQLTEYREKGWTFRVDEYSNHHNGNPEVDLYAKSPRTHEEFGVSGDDWDEVDEKHLLTRELDEFIDQRHEQNRWAIRDVVCAALRKRPDAKRVTVTIWLK